MNKNTLILIIALVVVVIILVWAFWYYRVPELPVVEPAESLNAVEELSEGTTITDIEKDLNSLLQEETLLGDIDAQLQQLEQHLEAEGL